MACKAWRSASARKSEVLHLEGRSRFAAVSLLGYTREIECGFA